MKPILIVNKKTFVLSYGITALAVSGLVFLFSNILWSDPDIIYAHISIERKIFYSIPVISIIFASLWSFLAYDHLLVTRRSYGWKVFVTVGLAIGFLTFFSLIIVLSIQREIVNDSPESLFRVFFESFFSLSFFGSIFFGWIVALGSLIPSCLFWKNQQKLER